MATGLFEPSSIYAALQQRNLLPEYIKFIGTEGQYTPKTNRLGADPKNQVTLAHEITHAAQNNLLLPAFQNLYIKQTKKEALTDQEKQFLDAYSKIMARGEYMTTESFKSTQKANKLYYSNKTEKEKADKDYNNYRTGLEERQAFGVGNMSVPGKSTSDTGGLHYDPTMATEFSLLMSLYNSLPETVKKQAEDVRVNEVQQARQKTPNPFPFLETVDVFANPFPRSIK